MGYDVDCAWVCQGEIRERLCVVLLESLDNQLGEHYFRRGDDEFSVLRRSVQNIQRFQLSVRDMESVYL